MFRKCPDAIVRFDILEVETENKGVARWPRLFLCSGRSDFDPIENGKPPFAGQTAAIAKILA